MTKPLLSSSLPEPIHGHRLRHLLSSFLFMKTCLRNRHRAKTKKNVCRFHQWRSDRRPSGSEVADYCPHQPRYLMCGFSTIFTDLCNRKWLTSLFQDKLLGMGDMGKKNKMSRPQLIVKGISQLRGTFWDGKKTPAMLWCP